MEFKNYLDCLETNLNNIAELKESKEVQYGHLFRYMRGEEKVILTVYNGKRGIHHVWSGEGSLRQELESMVCALTSISKGESKKQLLQKSIDEHMTWRTTEDGSLEPSFSEAIWAGSDESGKGDFFGPLVLSAVALNAQIAWELTNAGVKDCKLLTDKKILQLESIIKESALAFSVLQLKPRFYNKRYAEVLSQGGKLNQLLASGHINALTKVIEQLAAHGQACEYALIDQFTSSNMVIRPLEQRFPQVRFVQQTKAESNMAVAAASVLARAQFLRTMSELADIAGLPELPKGGGEHCTECARMLLQKFSLEELGDFVKLHFANFKRL